MKSRVGLKTSGTTLIELIMTVAVSSFAITAVISILLSESEMFRQFRFGVQTQESRTELLSSLLSAAVLNKTIELNPNMACILQRTTCNPATDAGPIDIYDANGVVIYASTLNTTGFDELGRLCNSFSPSGQDNCRYRYDLNWRPICPGLTPCVTQQLEFFGSFIEQAANRKLASNKRNFRLIRNYNPPLVPIQIAAGRAHSCVLLQSTEVMCWGENDSGQVGGGSIWPAGPDAERPYYVMTAAGRLRNIDFISAGWDHTCAKTTTGRVWCWGKNDDAQLGIGVFQVSPGIEYSDLAREVLMPNPVLPSVTVPLSGVGSIQARASTSCAKIQADGDVLCWGSGRNRRLPRHYDARMSGVYPASYFFQYAAPASTHTGSLVAISSYFNVAGKLPPDILAADRRDVKFFLGYWNSCVGFPVDRGISCWGSNQYSLLMDLNDYQDAIPHDVTGADNHFDMSPTFKFWNIGGTPGPYLLNIVDVQMSIRTNCAVVEAGGNFNIACWGYNNWGQIGNGRDRPAPPALINGDPHPTEPLWWGYHGPVEVWEPSIPGPVPSGVYVPVTGEPRPFWVIDETGAPGSRLTDILKFHASTGEFHCVIKLNGQIYCWGQNIFGQLGDNTTTPRAYPTLTQGLTGMRAIDVAGGEQHTCAIFTDRSVYCWGRNSSGELGLGDGTSGPSQSLPQRVYGF